MITTIENLKQEANITNVMNEEVLLPHLVTAEIECKSLIGERRYQDIALRNANDFEYKILLKAETNFAISFLIFSLSIKSNGEGVILREEENLNTNTLRSEMEINILSNHYFELGSRYIKLLQMVLSKRILNNSDLFLGCI